MIRAVPIEVLVRERRKQRARLQPRVTVRPDKTGTTLGVLEKQGIPNPLSKNIGIAVPIGSQYFMVGEI